MNTSKTTAKDFFLWAGAMVAFYWSVIAFIYLVFDYINYTFPNPLSYYPSDPYQSGISGEMASIIVLLPVYLLLMRLIRRDMAADPSKSDIWVRRWAIILTLFVAGAAIVIDLITLLTTFLNGEALTTAFLLKTLVIFLVAGGVFLHFIADLKGYWALHPGKRNLMAAGVGALAVVTIVAGFFIVGTPREARLARFDAQKVQDLQSIQSTITYYWQAKQALPASLSELAATSLYGGTVPSDPETGQPYGYRPTGALSFELCADFNQEGGDGRGNDRWSEAPYPAGVAMNDWRHGAGTVCFERTIDPSFYPPIKR